MNFKPFAYLSLLLAASCAPAVMDDAVFGSFSYSGSDARYAAPFNPETEFINPVLSGFFPDPSICRRGEDYFMVNSTFVYSPGITVLHSRDLVHWEQIGSVLDGKWRASFEGLPLNAGVYAPSICYNHFNGQFYLLNTVVGGMENFFSRSSDPLSGNWSEPVRLPELDGIDPSFFFDDDGRAYIVFSGKPEGGAQWHGHTAIRLYEFDYRNGRVVGKDKVLLEAGLHPEEKPVWIEAPHIYKVNGRYYLIAAEGGTDIWHSEVALVSDNVDGPYRPCPVNPILTQRSLPEQREDKVTSAGHADLVWTPSGDCWAVFLACRPYDEDFYNTGRETYLLPVDWSAGYPVILPEGESIPTVCRRPALADAPMADYPKSGNFEWVYDFAGGLDDRWLVLRNPSQSQIRTDAAGLHLSLADVTVEDEGSSPSFVAARQQHINFEASVNLEFNPSSNTAVAGLSVFQNERAHFVFGKQLLGGVPSIVLYQTSAGDGAQLLASAPAPDGKIVLKVVGSGAECAFYYAERGSRRSKIKWQPLAEKLDSRFLSTHSAGGFTGVVVGPYASSRVY